jgi:hypothetical protein
MNKADAAADKAAAEHARRLAKKRVDELRRETGVTYADISRRCGKGQQYLSEWFKRGQPRGFPKKSSGPFPKSPESMRISYARRQIRLQRNRRLDLTISAMMLWPQSTPSPRCARARPRSMPRSTSSSRRSPNSCDWVSKISLAIMMITEC